MDSTSNNNTFLHELNVHLFCFLHLINRCSQAVICSYGAAAPSDDEDSDNGGSSSGGDSSSGPSVFAGPIKNVRKKGNKTLAFSEKINEESQLVMDMQTCWDSMYYMVIRFLKMKIVYQHFIVCEENQGMEFPVFTTNNWELLGEFLLVMMASHNVTGPSF
ncbi:hypothetical protein EVJ58_g5811 [Rhodofomes roseus]|uniref:Uncharacterized protein n=1 Tax=Rhodofomes roseus TaxID=34475 RepID=A0A4Y9YA54_9APHY|nr:hypothetical protein EVJ58_g5811 [Rhodofomes roseus]